MKHKKTSSKKPTSKSSSNEFARIWSAAAHIGHQRKQGLLTPALRAGLSPFMTAAVDLALATVANPEEDTTAILQRVRLDLEAATKTLPSIADCLGTPITSRTAEFSQRALVRHAVTITREFSVEAVKAAPAAPGADVEYEPYTTMPAAQLEEPNPSRLWLIEHLWQRSGTGIVGGSAKGAKTWLCLDLALSVASGTPALDTFAVHRPGAVLFVSAEGGQAYLRERLNAMCAHRGLSLDALPHRLDIIPTAIRIDTEDGLGRLKATIKASPPVLLVLDPFVRLHRIDENSASSVSRLLSSLTELQQAHDLAILMAHHATKQGARRSDMGGQDFRGSSDLYAWGDSNVFLRKKGNKFVLAAEHRAAPATEKWTMEATNDEHPRLEIVEGDSDESPQESPEAGRDRLDSDILELLHLGPRSVTEIRAGVKGSNARVSEAMGRLSASKAIIQVGRNWTIPNGHGPRPRGLA